MPLFRTLRPALAVVALALAATSCSSSDDPTSTDPAGADSAEEGTPVDGGDLVIARPVDVKQLDPLEAVETATIHSLLMMFETLMVTTADGVEPQLADSLEVGDDGLTWTITLKEGITFSDGSAMDSEDVVATIQRVLDNPDVGFAYMFAPVASVTAVDATTVELVTSEPVAFVPSLLALWTGAILPAEAVDDAEAFFEAPIGTGPFAYDSWEIGGDTKLVKNETYWQEGLPHLDSVTWTTVSDDNARTTQLQADQADIVADAPFSAIEQLNAMEGVSTTTYPSLLQYFLMFNMSREPFEDQHVRTAIDLAIDKAAIQQAALFGEGEVACSILPPSMAYFSDDVPCTEQDLDAAAAELAESSVPDGFETTLLVGGTTGTASTAADIIVANLEEIGISV
jgi:peptide/nickel transport system substrate-binding protein